MTNTTSQRTGVETCPVCASGLSLPAQVGLHWIKSGPGNGIPGDLGSLINMGVQALVSGNDDRVAAAAAMLILPIIMSYPRHGGKDSYYEAARICKVDSRAIKSARRLHRHSQPEFFQVLCGFISLKFASRMLSDRQTRKAECK